MGHFERDPHTGHMTTGHEWNGITELNTPVPKVIWLFLACTVIFAIGYWILMPTWPIGRTYTKGLLGDDVRQDVTQSVKQAALDRAVWSARIEKESFADIQKDPRLMEPVRETGRALFGDNCAACHGRNAKGNIALGAPDLTDDDWLYGGTGKDISASIHDGRAGVMPAWSALGEDTGNNLTEYVLQISGQPHDAKMAAAAEPVFKSTCAACHGADGKGNQGVGAPNLTDAIWLHGGTRADIHKSIHDGRQGHMPNWDKRLDEDNIRVTAAYVYSLSHAKDETPE